MTQTANDRRELAVLMNIVLKHPGLPPVLQERLYDIFSEIHPRVDPYASPEGIEIYLDAFDKLPAYAEVPA